MVTPPHPSENPQPLQFHKEQHLIKNEDKCQASDTKINESLHGTKIHVESFIAFLNGCKSNDDEWPLLLPLTMPTPTTQITSLSLLQQLTLMNYSTMYAGCAIATHLMSFNLQNRDSNATTHQQQWHPAFSGTTSLH